MSEVLVVGSLNVDVIVRTPRFPTPGETILGDEITRCPGGKGMNQAVAASRLGMTSVGLVGCVGDDPDGEWLTSLAGRDQVECRLSTVAASTGTALITVDHTGENTIIVVGGANNAVTSTQIHEQITLARPEVVTTMLEIPMDAVMAAARAGQQMGARVILNPSPFRPLPNELLVDTDVLVLNEVEIEQATSLSWGENRARIAGWLAERQLLGVVTLGAVGAAVIQDRQITEIASPKVQAVDTVGCGDALTGALAVRLARGDDVEQATAFACRVAAHAATGHGAQPSYGTAEQVAALG